jgi:hypothetical protein
VSAANSSTTAPSSHAMRSRSFPAFTCAEVIVMLPSVAAKARPL